MMTNNLLKHNTLKRKAFIFDLDGVIVDTAKYHYLAWQKLAQQLDIPFTLKDNEALKGVSRVQSQEDKDKWLLQKNEEYLSYLVTMDQSEILPGVLPVLEFLKNKKQFIALGSASKNAKPILEKTNVLHYFDAIVDGNDVTNAKPDPEVFLKAARLGNIPTEDAIVFEDSVAGIQAANIAHMTSIGIGDATTLQEAQYLFKDFNEIAFSFLEELMK
jgi:beta-phosphoglucomutase